MDIPAVGANGGTGRANGAPGAGRLDERRWEFMLQAGRVPQGGQDQQAFLGYLCRQLESTAINTMIQAARRSTPQDGLLSGGFAGSIFQSLADEEYSRLLAARGGFGLGDQMFKQMAANQAAKAYGPGGAGNAPQGAPRVPDN
jgi:Rod binding domain-containing protein